MARVCSQQCKTDGNGTEKSTLGLGIRRPLGALESHFRRDVGKITLESHFRRDVGEMAVGQGVANAVINKNYSF